MTREEAIDRLREARAGRKEFLSVETLDMAIKALSQEPTIGQLFSCEEVEELRSKIWKQVEQERCEKSMNKAYEFGKNRGVRVYWNKQTDTVELPEAVFRYILSLVPTVNPQPLEGFIDGVHAMGYREGYKDAQKQKSGKWIPVIERLPEEYGEYLITWKNPKYPKSYIGICECEITDVYDHEHNRFEVEWLFDGYITTAYPDSYVIAWRPLPEPYEPQESEEQKK